MLAKRIFSSRSGYAFPKAVPDDCEAQWPPGVLNLVLKILPVWPQHLLFIVGSYVLLLCSQHDKNSAGAV